MKKLLALCFVLCLFGCITIARDDPEAKRGAAYNGKAEVTDGPLVIVATMEDTYSYVKVTVRNTGTDFVRLPYAEWTLGSKIETAPVKVFDKPYAFYQGELSQSDPDGAVPAGASITFYVGMRSHISNIEDDDEWRMNPILPSKKAGQDNTYDITLSYSYNFDSGKGHGQLVIKAS